MSGNTEINLTALEKGRDAYIDGVLPDDVPFSIDNPNRYDWLAGFHEKQAEDAEYVEDDCLIMWCEEQIFHYQREARAARKRLQATAPDVEETVRRIGTPVESWPGNCHGIADLLLRHGVVAGRLDYGHWIGPVHPESIFANRSIAPHGWVDMGDGIVCDPTRWVFEGLKPYIYLGTNENYDSGGNIFRMKQAADLARHIPTSPAGPAVITLPPSVFAQVSRHLDAGADAHLDMRAVHRLANLPPSLLNEAAKPLFQTLIAAGLGALIPIDNKNTVFNL